MSSAGAGFRNSGGYGKNRGGNASAGTSDGFLVRGRSNRGRRQGLAVVPVTGPRGYGGRFGDHSGGSVSRGRGRFQCRDSIRRGNSGEEKDIAVVETATGDDSSTDTPDVLTSAMMNKLKEIEYQFCQQMAEFEKILSTPEQKVLGENIGATLTSFGNILRISEMDTTMSPVALNSDRERLRSCQLGRWAMEQFDNSFAKGERKDYLAKKLDLELGLGRMLTKAERFKLGVDQQINYPNITILLNAVNKNHSHEQGQMNFDELVVRLGQLYSRLSGIQHSSTCSLFQIADKHLEIHKKIIHIDVERYILQQVCAVQKLPYVDVSDSFRVADPTNPNRSLWRTKTTTK